MSCECKSECICYFDCIFMLSVLAIRIRICGVHPCICLCSFMCMRNTHVLNACVSCRVLWSTEWVRGIIKTLLSWLCGGSCPGSGIVMDGVGCQSLGSLLASGTEVALLNTDLPRLSPNTAAHFKVNCLCGSVSSPPWGTRLLPFVWNLYRSLPTGVLWNVGVAGWCFGSCRHTRSTDTRMRRMNTHRRTYKRTHRGKQTSKPSQKGSKQPEAPVYVAEQSPNWTCSPPLSPGPVWQTLCLNVPSLASRHPNWGVWSHRST